jgi:MOSC domain-containing protein YiiM
MSSGKVVGIYISAKRGQPTVAVEQIFVIPGMGIVGDRYFRQLDKGEIHTKSGQEITLIEIETIESLVNDGIQVTPGETRRNIITRGVPLNDLVGFNFMVGNIQLRGVRLCEPCNYLANLTDPRILPALAHRGGLRAAIISEGTIHINDSISPL